MYIFRAGYLFHIMIYNRVYEELQLPVDHLLWCYQSDPLFSGLGK